MELTTRIENVSGNIIAYVDNNSVAWIEQPFNPATQSDWSSVEEAETWADNWIIAFNNRPEPTPLA